MRKHRSIIRLRKAASILLILVCLLTSLFPERVTAKKTEQEKNGLVLYYDFSQTESLLTGVLDMSGNDNTGFIKRVGGESPKEKYKIVNADIYGKTVKALSLPGVQTEPIYSFHLDVLMEKKLLRSACGYV